MVEKRKRVSLTSAQAQEGLGAELVSLLQGVTSDGRLTESEARDLAAWLEENATADLPSIAALRAEIAAILADGVIDARELASLQAVVEAVLPMELRKEARQRRREAVAEEKMAAKVIKDQSRRIDYFNFMAAGVHLPGRQAAIDREISTGSEVFLCREPGNPHDRNAVIVQAKSGAIIGYVPRDDAEILAPLLDSGAKYSADVRKILGYNKVIPVVQVDVFGSAALAETVGRPLFTATRSDAIFMGRPVARWKVVAIGIFVIVLLCIFVKVL